MPTLFAGIGSPGTIGASGGLVLSFNAITTSPAAVISADPQRTSITIHNPGTNDILFAPAFVQNTGSDVALVPSLANLGGCFRVYANGGVLVITGDAATKGWQAFATAASNNPLTVMTSHS